MIDYCFVLHFYFTDNQRKEKSVRFNSDTKKIEKACDPLPILKKSTIKPLQVDLVSLNNFGISYEYASNSTYIKHVTVRSAR